MDTGLDDCGALDSVRIWLTGQTAESLRNCDIPVGTIFSVLYTDQEDSGMEPTPVEVAQPTPELAPAAHSEPAVQAPAAPLQPSGNTESVIAPQPTAENLGDLAQKVDDPVLVVVLAIIALLGVGLWKHLGKVADQKAALDMKKLEIEAESAKRTPKAQPPPCLAANAALETKIAALEARLGKVESSSLALPPGFDAEELDERVRKLELERLKKGEA